MRKRSLCQCCDLETMVSRLECTRVTSRSRFRDLKKGLDNNTGLCCRPVSVCPSVMLVDCINTVEDIVKLLCRSISPIILVFDPSADTQLRGEPL